MPSAPHVRRLVLADFRSYAGLDLALDASMIVLTGDNGAGKTNVLEAVSLLTLGRGLRRADLADCARQHGTGGWAVSAEIAAGDHDVQLGTGIEPPESGETQGRRYRIDRAPVSSARAFADHIRVVWLTPAMDGLFSGSPGERRRFLDRLVLAVDAEHGARVTGLERALRNRNRQLAEPSPDRIWLDATEREVAELGVAVVAARHDTLARLSALIEAQRDDSSPFPWARLALSGELEGLMASQSALAVEECYRALLRDGRRRDAAAGRTLVGPHTSDLMVYHGQKNTAAALSSTGEQKALLTGLVVAHARLVAQLSGLAPIMLMDEIAAHFDPVRRERLFADLAALGGQVWLTGADPHGFAGLAGAALHLHVQDGRVAGRTGD